jgi:hypothetical protein
MSEKTAIYFDGKMASTRIFGQQRRIRLRVFAL